MDSTTRTKIGPCHGKPQSKIWIEGRKLTDAGWPPGTRYDRSEYANAIVLVKQPPDRGKYKVSGKGDKPIVDISGAVVARLFPAPLTHVTVTITAESVTITPSNP